MSKYHVFVTNSDGDLITHLNLSLVGMLNVFFEGWTMADPDMSDENILLSLSDYWDNTKSVLCMGPDDHTYSVFISNGDLLTAYDMNRLFESKKALLRWAKAQIKKKLSEKVNE